MSYFTHETSVIDFGVNIGPGTKVWHFCHIPRNANIGEKCSLGQNVFVSSNTVIGNRVKIQNNVSIFDGVTLEDDVFCGPSMVFTNVYNPRSAIVRKDEIRPTLVKRGASLGANCTVVCGVIIGEYAFIGAGALVNRDVPPYALVVGNPAKQIGWVSRFGVRLNLPLSGAEYAECPETGEIYSLEGSSITLVEEKHVNHEN